MSPRPGPARPTITFRIRPSAIKAIEAIAAAEQVDRSEMIRRLLAYAVRMMPKGWKP